MNDRNGYAIGFALGVLGNVVAGYLQPWIERARIAVVALMRKRATVTPRTGSLGFEGQRPTVTVSNFPTVPNVAGTILPSNMPGLMAMASVVPSPSTKFRSFADLLEQEARARMHYTPSPVFYTAATPSHGFQTVVR